MKLRAFILIFIFISHLTNAFSEGKKVKIEEMNKSIIIRKPLLTAMFHSKVIDKVEIKEINFAPGQCTGLHMHPVPVVGYIAQGSILFQIKGQPSKIIYEGEAFYEPDNTKIIHFDNISKNNTAKFIAFYLLKKENYELIRMLEKHS